MKTISVFQNAIEELDRAEGELVLDLSPVQRIYPREVRTLEELAELAEKKSVKLVLRSVNVAIYKVLKQLGLTQRFSFMN